MAYLNLEVHNSISNGKSKRTTVLREDGVLKKIEIFYEFNTIIPWSYNTVIDGHVFAVLLYAMMRGKNLKVHGVISQGAMRNIEELQLIWRRWKPDIYKKIEIIPDIVIDNNTANLEKKAISLFSGGVDSIFTILRHTKILPKNVHYPLRSALLIHGFDVDFYNETGFNQLIKRVQPFLDDLNLDLHTVRTNSRDLKIQDWDDSHGLELAACLNMYNDEFDFGLIGSSHSYEALKFPWGSTPVTDPLISGSKFFIKHDGSGFSRTEKISIIKDFPVACQVLKVCWSGSDQSSNCGKCEKCVRTQLSFLAVGADPNQSCFPDEFDINNINTIKINTISKHKALTVIANYARKNNIKEEWLSVLEARLAAWNPPDAALIKREKTGGFLKQILVKIIVNMGFSVYAKRMWRYFRREILKK